MMITDKYIFFRRALHGNNIAIISLKATTWASSLIKFYLKAQFHDNFLKWPEKNIRHLICFKEPIPFKIIKDRKVQPKITTDGLHKNAIRCWQCTPGGTTFTIRVNIRVWKFSEKGALFRVRLRTSEIWVHLKTLCTRTHRFIPEWAPPGQCTLSDQYFGVTMWIWSTFTSQVLLDSSPMIGSISTGGLKRQHILHKASREDFITDISESIKLLVSDVLP